jgi:hypothetical protein
MTLCPLAILAGCRNCPIVALCLVKGVIGDYKAPEAKTAAADSEKK